MADESSFCVAARHEAQAVAHLTERGFPPVRVEKDDGGVVRLVFAPVDEDRMYQLAAALPVHLSAKLGIVVGDASPFTIDD